MRARLLPILVTLAGACLLGLLVYGVTAQSASRTLDEDIAHGEHPPAPQPARELPTLAGGPLPAGHAYSLTSYRGRVVLLNFWASWCEPCQAEAPMLEHAQHSLSRHHATVLGVTYLDDSGDSRSFVAQHHLTYPNLRDTTGEFAHSYGTDQLPESFILDRSGHILAISRGQIDRAFLAKAVKLAEGSS
ncbi:MAG TPA: TlpA disulfide reductase family protein [Solirubrobacteraceae bacterium]|nr:TlpA disulfide reductase family protein [Solirubrobacteraceae bacterium]